MTSGCHNTFHLAKRVARITSDSADLSTVPHKYYEFTNVFSKAKVEILTSYHLYDLQIKLKNGCYCYPSSCSTGSFSYVKKLAKSAN